MSSKHFINDPSHLVNTALHAITLTNPGVALDTANKIIYRRQQESTQSAVSLVSGGGSGHEPSFAAMVGPGLLSAAVAGTLFASPSVDQVCATIMGRVAREAGVLVVVMNYTGDVLNFGVAVEKARAAGVRCDMVVVGDDVGVGRAQAGRVGRRGVAGTVLVHKIAGALAAQGRSLEEVASVARLVAENLVSVGASLERAHVPGTAVGAGGHLGDDEVEMGTGIHGEAGSATVRGLALPELVGRMLAQLLDLTDTDRAFLHVNSNELVLLVNNLGGLSVLEMGGILTEVVSQLERQYDFRPVRVLCGTYMTSLNAPAFSITLLNVVNTNIGGPGMVDLLDYPCEATGWSAPVSKRTWEEKTTSVLHEDVAEVDVEPEPSGLTMDPEAAQAMLAAGLRAVVAAESDVTRFDTVVGDGDCGVGISRGAKAVLELMDRKPLTGDMVVDLANIIRVVEKNMDGTSGALYAIFLHALSSSLRRQPVSQLTPVVWAGVLQESCDALARYTPARPGDRTVVDALYPFVETLQQTGDIMQAAEAARRGAAATRGMRARLGRAVYVGGSGFELVPDPGAWALASFFLGLAGGAQGGWEMV